MKKKALLLINLGSPDAPTPKAVGTYLNEFLTDKHVIDIPYILRQILVRAIIVPKRKYASALKYQQVWQEEGSPLIINTKAFTDKVRNKLADHCDVEFAMRYGNPSILSVLTKIKDHETIEILPLYPHNTKSSVKTAVISVKSAAKKLNIHHKIKLLPVFYNKDYFLNSLSSSLKNHSDFEKFEHILFSYHGLPQRHLPKKCSSCKSPCINVVDISQCYRAQCYETSKLVAQSIGLAENSYTTAFQSRLGKNPWIKPYSDHVIDDLKSKYQHIAVMTPSFVADCLETIEEVGIDFKKQFEQQSPRHRLTRISCLNDNDEFVEKFCSYIQRS